jgi:hypothetical protein
LRCLNGRVVIRVSGIHYFFHWPKNTLGTRSQLEWARPQSTLQAHLLVRFFDVFTISVNKIKHFCLKSLGDGRPDAYILPPFSFFFFQYWGLNSQPTPWATPPALCCDGFFQNRFSWTICLGLASNCYPHDLCLLRI